MRCMGAAAVCEKNVNSWGRVVILISMEAPDFSRGRTARAVRLIVSAKGRALALVYARSALIKATRKFDTYVCA